MEDEEDDLYGSAAPDASEQAPANGDAPVKTEQMDVSEESDEDSDDDIQITTERPEGVKAESVPPRATSAKPQSSVPDRTASIDPSPPSKILKTEHGRTTSPHAPTTTTLKGAPTHAGKEGKDYPQVRTSTVNLTANPTWPGVNKPITLVEIDADLAENSKLWRLPGTDQTDFFNYGFDEYTWTQYCLRQQTMAGTIAQQREEDMQMKAMLGGDPTGGAGGMPGMGGPGGGGGGVPPGMPPMDQMMQMMMAQGMDPSKMDMNQFMAMMGGMPGGPGGGTSQPGGGQGFGGQGGFGGQSPHPQGQFQPPSGPGGGQGFGGGNMNMEGMSPQQIAIMQQEQQQAMGGQGGGGRGRGGRRGRGGYY